MRTNNLVTRGNISKIFDFNLYLGKGSSIKLDNYKGRFSDPRH